MGTVSIAMPACRQLLSLARPIEFQTRNSINLILTEQGSPAPAGAGYARPYALELLYRQFLKFNVHRLPPHLARKRQE